MMGSKDLTDKAFDLGLKYEKKYRSCAQCTIAAIQDSLGIHEDSVYKCASGFAAGVGLCTDGSCGAYMGAVMMVSHMFGRSRKDEDTEKGTEDKHDSFRLATALHDRFIQEYGSVRCSDIHQKLFGRTFNLRSPEDKASFDDAGAHSDDTKCGNVVGKGARWAVEIIQKELKSRGENPYG